MASWEGVNEKWQRAQRKGWEAVVAAIDVGEDLIELKEATPHGEWASNATRVSHLKGRAAERWAVRLMELARNRVLLEEHKPDSQRQAHELIPKKPSAPQKATVKKHKAEADEALKALPAKQRKAFDAAVEKRVQVELDRLQNEAKAAVKAAFKTETKRLKDERRELTRLTVEVSTERQRYQDFINRKFNGFDVKAGLKTLKQALHPDRPEISEVLANRAMNVVSELSKILERK